MIRKAIPVLPSVLFAATCIAALPTSAAPGTVYDGQWSVLIVTEKGDCDRAYRYPIRITNGKVMHADAANSSFNINGKVANSGAVKVSVSRGEQRADGTGRLAGTSGGGKWKAASGQCTGQWTAEKRG
ncbi:MAG: hypothetical protein HXY30_07175 [Pseudorhodoplanes sp.]|nr:hypothetical protein [Pseudorhodoplanes sp.]